MKKCFLLLLSSVVTNLYAQTNAFPANGNVGIGISSPTTALQIGAFGSGGENSQILIPGIYNFERFSLGQLGNGNMALEMVNHSGVSSSYGVRLMTNVDSGLQGLQFQYATSKTTYGLLDYQTAMAITTGGNVGIGTITPNAKLAVNGNIRAKEVRVEITNWPDYVFKKNYELRSLQVTEQHIKANGHLPGMPSAADVKANGINVGEMNAKLLQKIEELTLHLIKQNKTIESIQAELAALKQSSKIDK